MGDNRNRVDDSTLAYIRKGMGEGMSASQIADKLPGRTRNGVIGIIDRHLKDVPRRAKKHLPKTDRKGVAPPPRQTIFAEPSAPRRFSWQDLPA